MSSTKPTTASISDLAPFVAAVLKDKTVTDLTRENEELRQREEERLLVEITGRGGTPVHYQASLKDGHPHPWLSDRWIVNFEQKEENENGEDVDLPLSVVGNLEVRLGGIVVSDMRDLSNDIEDDGCTFSDHEEDSQIDLADYINDGFSVRFNQTPLHLIINGVEFNKEKIGSLLSIVERMRNSTTNHTN
ncbi:hypothetical protein FRACYDRAFT_240923 [Fragilariopsis cylindrus CCMP1102]|uniref:Uncharacterized protein n=1 Tax=Fragilariopsis cylindrus CCMP1102 TaxID=635003 RepID=A0A1E7F972_9STRA|nr:hypothetical protein FRACYDRAFT_240923 [Fragilariopsis cylindrus CCMP1102]|eukprot:OEU14383.1 hypothetical protein FRACYDRAFT_240923 [Fragilariopsis cylindrus CCMP1102]